MSASIISFPTALAPSYGVPLARVLPGARPLSTAVSGLNSTYHGEISTASGTFVMAYIKDLDARQLSNELIACTIARMTGISVPAGYLAIVESGILPVIHAPTQIDGSRLVFACADAATPSLKQFYNPTLGHLYSTLLSHLAQWPRLGDLYGLDTWLANVDRNLGNMLVGARDIFMIDHGQCLTGPSWTPGDLKAAEEYINKISNWLSPYIDGTTKPRIAAEAEAFAHLLPDTFLEAIPRISLAENFLSSTDASAFVDFLKERRAHVLNLADKALNLLAA